MIHRVTRESVQQFFHRSCSSRLDNDVPFFCSFPEATTLESAVSNFIWQLRCVGNASTYVCVSAWLNRRGHLNGGRQCMFAVFQAALEKRVSVIPRREQRVLPEVARRNQFRAWLSASLRSPEFRLIRIYILGSAWHVYLHHSATCLSGRGA